MHRMAAMVVFRGGGYRINNGSGAGAAQFFADRGMVGVEVEYRTEQGPGPCAEGPGPLYPKPLQDAARAVRLLRSRAADFGLDPNRIGVTGFSAGGHLASLLCGRELPCEEAAEDDLAQEVSCRPDVCILCYAVLSLLPSLRGPGNLSGSAERLLGASASDLDMRLSAELRVALGHPPTFIWHTRADAIVPVSHADAYAAALAEAGVPHKMAVFEGGPHALGLALEGEFANDWTEQALDWLGEWKSPKFCPPAMVI